MKTAVLFFAIFSLCISNDCSHAQVMSSKKILIVYLSRTNNTKVIAEIIKKNVGGRLVALELEKPYPENYKATVAQVVNENENGYLPALKTQIDSIQNYDVVFLGFPTWDMKMPPPVKSFYTSIILAAKRWFLLIRMLAMVWVVVLKW